MSSLFNAVAAFSLAATVLGTGPFAGPAAPHWEAVKADLTAVRSQERLAAQVGTLFRAGTPHPDADR